MIVVALFVNIFTASFISDTALRKVPTVSSPASKLVGTFIDDNIRPTILVAPGGGYKYTSPRESEPVVEEFNKRGYHVVIVNYRETVEEPYPMPQTYLACVTNIIKQDNAKISIPLQEFYNAYADLDLDSDEEIELDLVFKLFEHKNIIGIKDSSANMKRLEHMIEYTDGKAYAILGDSAEVTGDYLYVIKGGNTVGCFSVTDLRCFYNA